MKLTVAKTRVND